jgi:cell wall-associated NlpC family hydrolase
MPRTVTIAGVVVLVVALAVGALAWLGHDPEPARAAATATAGTAPPTTTGSDLTFERVTKPARTVVRGTDGTVLATFTDRARTVAVTGPERTFEEPGYTDAAVSMTTWVRIAPKPWARGAEKQAWFRPWLENALEDTSPDVLEVATQYFADAPDKKNDDGLRVAGNASFGPELGDGFRAEASDFYDFLGVSWRFKDGVKERPSGKRLGALDCSGYIRMVFGYRLSYPLLGSNTRGPGLPRRAFAMAEFGPGSLLIPDKGHRPSSQSLNGLQPGDLLFFSTDAAPGLDHSAIYLGVDSDGMHRFMSSRSMADGPTMGDLGGASILDGGGRFANNFRAARRI